MTQPLTFTTHLPTSACIQSLHKLAAQKNFYRSVGRSTIHIEIDSIENNSTNLNTSFRIYLHCGLHTKFPIYVYFKLDGDLQHDSNKNPVKGRLQMQTQSTTFRKFLVFWSIVIAFTLIGIISRISTSTPIENLFVFVVAVFGSGLGYFGYLYRAYKLGKNIIPGLIYQALCLDPIIPDNNQDPPEWIADLSKTR